MNIAAIQLMKQHSSRRSWIQVALLSALCLLLGAVTTMAVSIGLQLWGRDLLVKLAPRDRTTSKALVPGGLVHPSVKDFTLMVSYSDTYPGRGTISYHAIVTEDLRAARSLIPHPTSTDGSTIPAWVYREWRTMLEHRLQVLSELNNPGPHAGINRSILWVNAYGWPFAATSAYKNVIYDSSTGSITTHRVESWHRLDQQTQNRLHTSDSALAISPIWPGFALNSLFYAGCFAGLIFGLITLVCKRRVGRGHCRNCNYNLAGLASGAACPECGASSAPSSVKAQTR